MFLRDVWRKAQFESAHFPFFHRVHSFASCFGSIIGAGPRCWSASFCPHFVICPEFVHFLSYDCPVNDYFLSLSCFWLLSVTKLPTFVQICSTYCPPFLDYSNFCPLFVHTPDTNSGKKQKTKSSQKLDWGILFFFNLVTLHLDKHWTILGLLFVQCLSTYCPYSWSHPKYLYITVFQTGTKTRYILDIVLIMS